MPHARRLGGLIAALGLCLFVILIAQHAAAQPYRNPFAVGAQEAGVGHVNALSAWIIGQESNFYQALARALAGAKHSVYALIVLLGLGFAYGVFHAAGPGHGKAVITSYMVSNERALRRGIVIAFLAALLQGLVAIVAIGGAAALFNATAQRMIATAHALEIAAYCGIILLGLMLVFRKGSALIATARAMLASSRSRWSLGSEPELATAPAVLRVFANEPQVEAAPQSQTSMFRATAVSAANEATAECGPQCAHVLALDPTKLGDGFSWKSAALTIVTAGARPCSGAILVLVFGLAQGVFMTGVFTVVAIALGTAMTTCALATTAVFGKRLAMRIAGRTQSRRAQFFGQFIEVGAAFCVLLFGAVLLYATLAGTMPTN